MNGKNLIPMTNNFYFERRSSRLCCYFWYTVEACLFVEPLNAFLSFTLVAGQSIIALGY